MILDNNIREHYAVRTCTDRLKVGVGEGGVALWYDGKHFTSMQREAKAEIYACVFARIVS